MNDFFFYSTGFFGNFEDAMSSISPQSEWFYWFHLPKIVDKADMARFL